MLVVGPRLLTFPNVLITSHQAFFTRNAINAIVETTLANIAAFERETNINSIVIEAITNHLHPKDTRVVMYKAIARQTSHYAQVPKKESFTSLFDLRKIGLKTSETNDRFDFSRSFNA